MVMPKTSGILPELAAPRRGHLALATRWSEPLSVGSARRAGRKVERAVPASRLTPPTSILLLYACCPSAPLLHLHHHLEEPHRRLLRRRRPFNRLPLAIDHIDNQIKGVFFGSPHKTTPLTCHFAADMLYFLP